MKVSVNYIVVQLNFNKPNGMVFFIVKIFIVNTIVLYLSFLNKYITFLEKFT